MAIIFVLLAFNLPFYAFANKMVYCSFLATYTVVCFFVSFDVPFWLLFYVLSFIAN